MPHPLSPEDRRLVGADRVLAILVELARHPDGATLEQLSAAMGSPKSSVHRALASLRRASLADLTSRGVYELGNEFFSLAFRNYESRSETSRVEPLLRSLSAEFGETAHYAVLEGCEVVYRAKVDPPLGAVKLTSTVGGRNPVHSTAVGKLLLSYIVTTRSDLSAWLAGSKLTAKTPFTITDPDALISELQVTRARGYGVDDQENELGINCVSVPVFMDRSEVPAGAVSVSAVRFRCPLERLIESVPLLLERAANASVP